jgi:hypothetical protein
VGAATFAGVGNAAGTSTALAVGFAAGVNPAVGNAAGTSTATAVGFAAGITPAVGASVGTATVLGVSAPVILADVIPIYKSGGHVLIEAAAGPSYVLDILVASNVGDDVTVYDTVTNMEIISSRNYADFVDSGGSPHGGTAVATVAALTVEFNT